MSSSVLYIPIILYIPHVSIVFSYFCLFPSSNVYIHPIFHLLSHICTILDYLIMSDSPITVASALFYDRPKPAQPVAVINSALNDAKFRDSALKFSQQLLKLSAHYSDDKSNKAIYNKTAGVIGITRRLLRFIRWIPNAANLTKNIFSSEPHILILKSLHHTANIIGGVCEDITTLDKLQLTTYNPDLFETIRKYSVFVEACSGAVLTSLVIRQEKQRFKAMLQAAATNEKTTKDQLVTAFIALHLQQMTAIKWYLEVFAQSYGFDLHNQELLSIIASLLSSGDAMYVALFRYIVAARGGAK